MLRSDASIYEPSLDPSVSAIVTSFHDHDPQDASNSYDILTGWKNAVDELSSLGVDEITFAVFRNANKGSLSGGPSIKTVRSAVAYATKKNLAVTILPVFETETGWRGNYDPTGEEQTRFQTAYKIWIKELASIRGVDRFNIGSELSRIVRNPRNLGFMVDLIQIAKQSFETVGNQSGRIGYAANFDAYSSKEHRVLLSQPGIDFFGVSAYRRLVDPANAEIVSSTNRVPRDVFRGMVNQWTHELDRLTQFAQSVNLPVVIQEFGVTQKNYASVAPHSTSPGDFVNASLPHRYAADPLEQRAAFESLINALDGRGNEIESVTFWTWEHQASRGRRTIESMKPSERKSTEAIEQFAIWPNDSGGGQFLAEFLATRRRSHAPSRITNPFFNSSHQSD